MEKVMLKKDSNGIIVIGDDGSDWIFCNGVDLISSGNLPTEIDALAEGRYYKMFREKNPKTGTVEDKVLEINVKASDVDAAVAQFKSRRERHPNRDAVIDYEHQTLSGNEAPAAGWISDLNAVTRDGIRVAKATVSSWTDRAKQYLTNKEYRYASPVFGLQSIDKETGEKVPCIFKHLSLTNEPLMDQLQPIVAKHISQTILGKDTTMDDLLERLRYFLNLPITATAEECKAELQKLIDQLATAASSVVVTAKDLLAFLTGVKTEIAAKEELTTLKAEKIDAQFTTIIAKATADGKILPVQKSDERFMSVQKDFAAKDMKAFEEYWTKQPKIAPTGVLPAAAANEVAAKDLTEEDKTVGAAFGLKEADIIAANKS